MPENPRPCLRQQELVETVQAHLKRISELTQAVSAALANGSNNVAAELDRQVDLEFGMKERGMGALHQHRKEHGC